SRGFLLVGAAMVVAAGVLLWTQREEYVESVRASLRWETAILGWFVVCGLGALHESAHGLTCKHYGGDGHEIGVLVLLFAPCFYCNVSDAWLFRERRRRVAVMLAGVVFDFVVWAFAVFVWRLTETDTLVHHVALVVLTMSGVATLFNLNPLI